MNILEEIIAHKKIEVEKSKEKQPLDKLKNFVRAGLAPAQINKTPDLTIGSKNFTEQFILSEIFAQLIENYSDLNVETQKGLAGTKICFDALKKGEIDIYPEYTGTGLFVILKENKIPESKALYNYVKNKCKNHFDIEWLQPLGFNNTWALIMREDVANKYMIETISDLKNVI